MAEADDHLCTMCHAWMCRGDDAWCGYCGAGCARLQLTLIPAVLEAQQIAPLVCVAITNASCAELELGIASAMPNWLTLRIEPGLKVGPGETARMWAEARTFELDAAASTEIVLSTPAGEARAELLVVTDTPKLSISPREIVFWSANGTGRGNGASRNAAIRTQVSLAPEQGRLRLLTVRSELAKQLTVDGFTGPRLASRQDPVQVEVGVEDERLLPQRWPPALVVEYEGPHGSESLTVEMQVVVKQPPQLSWEGADEDPVNLYYSEHQLVDVVLSNRDPNHRDGGGNNADLVIDSVTLTAPAGLAVAIDSRTEFPLHLAGGALRPVRFELQLGAAAGAPQLVHLDLEVRSNGGSLNRKLPLRLEPLQLFAGIVAVDFGSSNTCCAVVALGAEPTLLKIDGGREVAPTIVRYLDLLKTPAEITTGVAVKDLAAKNDEVAASTVSRLKQRLGDVREDLDVRPRNSDIWVTRRASEAAADYLREIRRLAESQESAIFWDFILTHPARCPLRQYRRMQEALGEAFGHEGKRIEYMQEPIAALIPLLVERAARTQTQEYTVASFDLGGGTTDVAVVRVRQTSAGNGEVEIEPEILFCQGVNFGGENLTDYLESALRERCVAQLNREKAGSELISEASKAPAKADVLMNSAELRGAAETLKASLSQSGEVNEPELVTLRIRLSDNQTQLYPFRFDSLCNQGGIDLRVDFIAHVGSRVRELTMLLQPARDRGISIETIQLSGKTSFLQEVGRTLQQEYPDAAVIRPADPKECVVRGACQARAMRSGKVRLKLPRAMHRMTSSIGIWPSRTSAFQPILLADMEIPVGGAEASTAFAWDGHDAISLWENIGGGSEEAASLYDRRLLTRLGSWQPVRSEGVRAVALQVGLKDLEISVALVEQDGAVIRCEPTSGGMQ